MYHSKQQIINIFKIVIINSDLKQWNKTVIPKSVSYQHLGDRSNQTHFPAPPLSYYSHYTPHPYCQSQTKEATVTSRTAIFFRRVMWGKEDDNQSFKLYIERQWRYGASKRKWNWWVFQAGGASCHKSTEIEMRQGRLWGGKKTCLIKVNQRAPLTSTHSE